MSLHRQVHIYCDNNEDERCPYFGIVADADECETVADARAWMKSQGWVTRKGPLDLCSVCRDLV